ncbi:UvrD-helicase domain-containing protein [Methylogaea oryzae]|uniref:RecBCD enzyme subunit RecB n=3 Tax=Methylogaea oryzae TaxID=1295382 RepID=A0A8D4VRA2_9GAMM|nr:UvrD-helicase domain-containing protein [Methylogaea oryzae]BBL71792.1 RecBCD enzyme subunit RecB [Methylogaea oryzae]
MKTFSRLEIHDIELPGLTLIEAGAGTGKTWTITGLYLRLLLEQGLDVEQILVVTYTKAATAELHERIRRRLADMLAALQAGGSEDAFCAALLLAMDEAQRDRARARLTRAISGFDEAAIFTIHGFCQRALTDHAFEAGSGFEQELVPDERELLREVVDDFWRREVYPAGGLWVDFLAETGQSPDAWLAEIAPHVGKPYLRVAEGDACAAAFTAPLEQAYAEARALWRGEREAIMALLLAGDLDGNKYRAASVPKWCAAFDGYFASARPGLRLPDNAAKLTPEALAGAAKKGRTPPSHAFFDACQGLIEAAEETAARLEAKLAAGKARLLAWCNAELPKRKAALQVLSYNDLLNCLAEALDAEHGAHLAQGLRERYRAALIDEFQDTDPVQYRIFEAIYGGSGQPVFFVGDPKQAIYSFRGADVYSYLQARHQAERLHTLDTNQRSTAELIAAVNALFSGHGAPFLVEDIDFRPAQASTRPKPWLAVEGDGGAPFRFDVLPQPPAGSKGAKPWSKERAAEMAAESTAADIARLLGLARQGRARLVSDSAIAQEPARLDPLSLRGTGGEGRGYLTPPHPDPLPEGEGTRKLNGGDIAVLVSTHHQGRRMELALRALGIPSVRQGQDNVYAGSEAMELERVLLAAAEPGREPLVKGALATELMGWRAGELFALQQDEAAWEEQLDRFHRYHALWRDHGFMPMLRAWFDEAGVAERLLAHGDGERRLTNLLHLAELLQVESHERPGLDALLGWFGRKLHQPERGEEAALLRLESDAERVKIVTVHTSKGLEYPVVYCPFLWDGGLLRKDESSFAYHDERQQPWLTFQPDDSTLGTVARERLAEKLRLLYVALTRAKHRCQVVWGHVSGMELSALFWLLHGGDCVGAEDSLAALERRAKALDHGAIVEALERLAAGAPDAIGLAQASAAGEGGRPAAEPRDGLAAQAFTRGVLQPAWRMTSFSALSAGRHSEAPDHDAASAAAPPPPAGDNIFTFPRGANAGTCLHAVFENWEFTCREREPLERLAARKLKAYAIDEKWNAVVAAMVDAVLDAPLDGAALRLNRVPAGQRLVELEFTFALQGLQARRLQALLADPAYGLAPAFVQAAGQLAFDAAHGYMKGYIDLVFAHEGRYYVVDWKSNWLGASPADYISPRLEQAVAREHYYLQYLIYCLALHRYLRLRQPDYDYGHHFGGVYYLFLRGIHPAFPGAGIHADRPSPALIDALDRLFEGEEAA